MQSLCDAEYKRLQAAGEYDQSEQYSKLIVALADALLEKLLDDVQKVSEDLK